VGPAVVPGAATNVGSAPPCPPQPASSNDNAAARRTRLCLPRTSTIAIRLPQSTGNRPPISWVL